MNIVDRNIVLSLNRNWQAINVRTVAEAFIAMNGGNEDHPPVKALDISYAQNADGTYNFDEMPSITPVSWLEWMALPIREYDLVVNTSKYKIRVPTVIVSINYAKIPPKRFRPTKKVLYEIQKGICGYSGKKISFNAANIEHKTPRSHGGKDNWENLMVVDKDINSKRGNKPLEEVGLTPLFHHKEPKPMPASYAIKKLAHMDWRWFLDLE